MEVWTSELKQALPVLQDANSMGKTEKPQQDLFELRDRIEERATSLMDEVESVIARLQFERDAALARLETVLSENSALRRRVQELETTLAMQDLTVQGRRASARFKPF